MKKLLACLVAILGLTLYVSPVTAQYGQYGDGAPSPSQTIMIIKMVGMPTTIDDPNRANFVNNLSPSDPRFGASQFIFFKITIQNTSNVTLHNVVFKDFVPAFLTPVAGPGNFDSNSRIITFNIGDMGPGVQNTYFLKMQIVDQNSLPADKGLFCEVNTAQAFADNTNTDRSTSQFCIEKKVLGATTVPTAGPEFGLLIFGANLLAMTTGLYLKKKV